MTFTRAPMPVRFDFDPVALPFGIAAEQLRQGIDAVDDDVDVSVVIVIAEGTSARGHGGGDSRTGFVCDLFESTVAEIAIQVFVLCVGSFGFRTAHFGIYMAVGYKDVQPSIVVHIEEAEAPAKIARVDAQA